MRHAGVSVWVTGAQAYFSGTRPCRDSVSDAGPCIIVVRDKDGHVFGGFASQSWHLSPKFYGIARGSLVRGQHSLFSLSSDDSCRAFLGDERCFLFSVRPKLMLYLAVGGNDNFQYLNINTETLPNGLVRVEGPDPL